MQNDMQFSKISLLSGTLHLHWIAIALHCQYSALATKSFTSWSVHFSPGNPLMRGAPSRGFVSLCITIYRWKNHFCQKKLQWCLWRFMNVSSLLPPIYRNLYRCAEVQRRVPSTKNPSPFLSLLLFWDVNIMGLGYSWWNMHLQIY